MTKPLDKKRFKREASKRKDRDDVTLDDLSDAANAIMSGPQHKSTDKREPTKKERTMCLRLIREKR